MLLFLMGLLSAFRKGDTNIDCCTKGHTKDSIMCQYFVFCQYFDKIGQRLVRIMGTVMQRTDGQCVQTPDNSAQKAGPEKVHISDDASVEIEKD